jgi:hypothetical protein
MRLNVSDDFIWIVTTDIVKLNADELINYDKRDVYEK